MHGRVAVSEVDRDLVIWAGAAN